MGVGHEFIQKFIFPYKTIVDLELKNPNPHLKRLTPLTTPLQQIKNSPGKYEIKTSSVTFGDSRLR
jgi:hypothetical protein